MWGGGGEVKFKIKLFFDSDKCLVCVGECVRLCRLEYGQLKNLTSFLIDIHSLSNFFAVSRKSRHACFPVA